MNYINQIKGFWIAQEAHQLGTSEIALYFYLLEVGNKTGWTGTFYRNNYKVMADLSIRSYKTLQSLRDKLKSIDVITFSQKNGDANVCYQLSDLGKKYLGNGEGLVQGKGEGKGKGLGKVNINQTKPNQTSFSEPQAASVEPKKNVGSDLVGKQEKTEFWEMLVDAWFVFYGNNFKKEDGSPARPMFKSPQAANLKTIVTELKKISLDARKNWTEEYAVYCLKGFFQKALNHDDWMRTHFELGNMLSKFNSITNATKISSTPTPRVTGNNGKSNGAIRLAQELAIEIGGI